MFRLLIDLENHIALYQTLSRMHSFWGLVLWFLFKQYKGKGLFSI